MADDDYEYRPKSIGSGYQRRHKGSTEDWQDSDSDSGAKSAAQTKQDLGYKASAAAESEMPQQTKFESAEMYQGRLKKWREGRAKKAAVDQASAKED